MDALSANLTHFQIHFSDKYSVLLLTLFNVKILSCLEI